jgi:hypothetical protein
LPQSLGPHDGAVGDFETLLRDALLVTALLTLPILAVATLVGALIAIVQAATQIQEQTLTPSSHGRDKSLMVAKRQQVRAFSSCSFALGRSGSHSRAHVLHTRRVIIKQ